MRPSVLIVLALMASGLTWLGTVVLCRWLPRLGLLDIPNVRSSHSTPIPRSGGLSFVLLGPVLTTVAARWSGIDLPPGTWVLLLGALPIAVASLVDDCRPLPAHIRFSAHFMGALILLADGRMLRELVFPGAAVWSLGWLSAPLTLLWIVGLTNAFNFMDGIDGLAAGQAVIAATTVAWLAQVRAANGTALAMAVLAGAVLGFLLHNWPPARIFMGDVGSACLGFTFAGWAVLSGATHTSPLPFLAWVVVLAPFLFDTSVTLVGRIIRGQRWYEAHREHFYQRLIRQGWSHLAVTSLYLGVAAFFGLVVVVYYGYGRMAHACFIGAIMLPLLGLVVCVWRVEVRARWRPTRMLR